MTYIESLKTIPKANTSKANDVLKKYYFRAARAT